MGNKILFRASSTGHLMTDPKSSTEYFFEGLSIPTKKYNQYLDMVLNGEFALAEKLKSVKVEKDEDDLSESTKTHLVDIMVSNKYLRNTDFTNKATTKGLLVEEDSLTLYSKVKKMLFTKNKERLRNDFIIGTPDIIEDRIIDIKSSWDIFTYFRAKQKKINPLYYWQLQSYMELANVETSNLAYCLIDTPYQIIQDEKRKLLWRMGVTTDQDKGYLDACEELEQNHAYGDIPDSERVFEIEIKRDREAIDKLYKRIELARVFLKENYGIE